VAFNPAEPIAVPSDTDPSDAPPAARRATQETSSSRYERKSGGLPRLGDDPEWTPPGSDFIATVIGAEPRRWFRRLRL